MKTAREILEALTTQCMDAECRPTKPCRDCLTAALDAALADAGRAWQARRDAELENVGLRVANNKLVQELNEGLRIEMAVLKLNALTVADAFTDLDAGHELSLNRLNEARACRDNINDGSKAVLEEWRLMEAVIKQDREACMDIGCAADEKTDCGCCLARAELDRHLAAQLEPKS